MMVTEEVNAPIFSRTIFTNTFSKIEIFLKILLNQLEKVVTRPKTILLKLQTQQFQSTNLEVVQ